MRITGGALKGIRMPRSTAQVRPAMEKMRLALFSILGDVESARFLDLFSGSGVVGIEAYSRGAEVTLVEKDRATARRILRFLARHGIRVRLHTMPSESYIRRKKQSFDIVYCDPPFSYSYKEDLLEKIATSDLLTDSSTVILHYPKGEHIAPQGLVVEKRRHYGGSALDFYRRAIDSA